MVYPQILVIFLAAQLSIVSASNCQDTIDSRDSAGKVPQIKTGDTVSGIKHFIKIIPFDTTSQDHMPIVSPGDFTGVDIQPVPIKKVAPAYPSMGGRHSATVWVKCLIDTSGKVLKSEVVKSDNEIFNQAAIEAANQWIFTPGILNGKPVITWVAIPFRFKFGI